MTDDEADRCGPPVLVFRSAYLKGVRFECRRIERAPPENTIAFIYKKNGDNLEQSGVGVFEDGAWRRTLKGKPFEGEYLWAAMVDEL